MWVAEIGAAWKVADIIEDGSTVAIFGLGAVGLAVLIQIQLHYRLQATLPVQSLPCPAQPRPYATKTKMYFFGSCQCA